MAWFSDHGWLAWVGLALALGAFEAASVDFVFLMLAGGALSGALTSALGAPFGAQVVVAVVVSAALLVLVRPVVRRRFMVPEGLHGIGTAAQVGRSALVISTVTALDGRVKLGGETWSARKVPGAADFLPGQEVRVVAIEGATAIVTSAASGRELE